MEYAGVHGAGEYASQQRTPPITSIDTEHNDMINDIQLDYYGKRLVTCSGDRTFRVYDVSEATAPSVPPQTSASSDPNAAPPSAHVLQHIVQLPEDSNAPMHRIAWAHPKFGSLLAMACQDGRVYVYREELHPNGSGAIEWRLKYMHTLHSLAVLSIAWAPYEYGLCLASASADGQVSFLTRVREGWVTSSSFMNSPDSAAVTSVSWAPYNSLGSQGPQGPVQRVVTGSVNSTVQIWQLAAQENQWTLAHDTLRGHEDWVRDVAWAPNVGIPANLIASGSDDHTVRVWSQDEIDGEWKMQLVHTFRSPVYRISWSLTGTVLSVAVGDDEVTFWKQLNDHEWVQLSSVTENGAQVLSS
uniref:Anaphase-promoting complex subunit 4 WD40 domain-containing protein n=1 Tax=Globisporangium ultimum (strain ATCC 200006 / CBS 805.95 / DAOM BR144) TaxID=431595 RepID=K3W770_GLOUD